MCYWRAGCSVSTDCIFLKIIQSYSHTGALQPKSHSVPIHSLIHSVSLPLSLAVCVCVCARQFFQFASAHRRAHMDTHTNTRVPTVQIHLLDSSEREDIVNFPILPCFFVLFFSFVFCHLCALCAYVAIYMSPTHTV